MFMNSFESDSSFCHSRISCSQFIFTSSCSLAFSFDPPDSLYFQCAAIPNSAVRCISKVRIWISNGTPSEPMTVVCSDWYMFGFGIAM